MNHNLKNDRAPKKTDASRKNKRTILVKTALHLHLRTLLLTSLSLLITVGGWLFTKHFLDYKETQLLAKSGQLPIAESGFSLRQQTDAHADSETKQPKDPSTKKSSAFTGITISERIRAKILDSWASDAFLLSQDPQANEIDMEQAITTGIDWIRGMSQKGFLPANLAQHHYQDVSAILYTLEEQPHLPQYLLSRWNISYTAKDICIILLIHAATGEVWQAKIIAENSKLSDTLLAGEEALLNAAFPFLTGGGCEFAENLEDQSHQILVISPEHQISARVQTSLYQNDSIDCTMVTLLLSSR